jgi:predicted transcriptional regulator of viral defense system
MKKTRIQIAKPDIIKYLDKLASHVLKLTEIAAILSQERAGWRLTQRTTTQQFITFLIEQSELKQLDFPFPYRSECRYVWGDVPLLEVLLTLKTNAYFSHYTAIRMHGLTEQVPKTIYLNHEQRPQPQNPHLEQGRIAAAFSRKPRMSQNSIDFDGVRICMVNGMFTNQLGVANEKVSYDSEKKLNVRVTNVERTLIDIAVRPAYSGGVFEVQKAFLLAKDNVSVNALAAMLQRLKYVYPYHQAIGYYLERAGYRDSLLELLRRFPMDYDFYLAHEMGETEYVKEWKLYIPKGF